MVVREVKNIGKVKIWESNEQKLLGVQINIKLYIEGHM